MKIIVVGASGTIGGPVAQSLSERHEVVRVGRTSGDVRADITEPDSVRVLYEAVKPFDAVVSAAGRAAFGRVPDLGEEDFRLGLLSKLMGQVNLFRLGLGHISEGGSFTLTSGMLARHPTPGSAAVSMVNAALEAFARAAVLDLDRGIRLNVVSPPWVRETLEALGRDPEPGLPASSVAAAYVASVEGDMSGAVLDAADYG